MSHPETYPNESSQVVQHYVDAGGNHIYATNGLTKREKFAESMLQGLLSNSIEVPDLDKDTLLVFYSERAVEYADALIAALNK